MDGVACSTSPTSKTCAYDNWAQILYRNNPGIDRLNGCPLTQARCSRYSSRLQLLEPQ